MKKVIVITGPTGSGKTSLSVKIAKHFNTDVINGDSVQIYKDYNIGSAKITLEEMDNITHHLLDIKNPGELFSIYEYQKLVRDKIETLKLPLIAGGSGLYIQSALYDYKLQEHNEETMISVIEAKEKLKTLDPNLNTENLTDRRIINAYHAALKGSLRSEKKESKKPLYDLCIIYLDIDRSILKDRVSQRLSMMMENGFIDEVKKLRDIKEANLNIIGYQQINQYLEGKITLEEAEKLIITKTMQFAKRQKTWVKNQMNAYFMDALDPKLEENALSYIEAFLKESK